MSSSIRRTTLDNAQRSNSDRRPSYGWTSTESTRDQQEAEWECEPYFVDLATLSKHRKQELYDIGLLVSENNEQYQTIQDSDTNKATDYDVQDQVCLLYDRHITYLRQLWGNHDDNPCTNYNSNNNSSDNYNKIDNNNPCPSQPQLKSGFVSLDASRTWMIYWCLQAVDLLEHQGQSVTGSPPLLSKHEIVRMIQTIERCFTESPLEHDPRREALLRDDNFFQTYLSATHTRKSTHTATNITMGGFGGGPGQLPHAATTYAAVLALSILAGRWQSFPPSDGSNTDDPSSLTKSTGENPANPALRLLSRIRRPLYVWMTTYLHDVTTGSFCMQHDGEVDVRATYCVVAVAKLLNLLSHNLCHRSIDYVAQCQSTLDGGFGAEPWSEAHGGYTFCAVASLELLNGWDSIHVEKLAQWLALRQMSYEGGFNGRANKLVDGCYSFWQGSAMAIVSAHLQNHEHQKDDRGDPWLHLDGKSTKSNDTDVYFDVGMLQRYILLCAQGIQGGMRDKPSKNRDFYHSCYVLSGLSVSQHCGGVEFGSDTRSRIHATHPVYNIRPAYVRLVLTHFTSSLV